MELVARTVVEIGAREDGWWECVWPGTNTEHITFGNSHLDPWRALVFGEKFFSCSGVAS